MANHLLLLTFISSCLLGTISVVRGTGDLETAESVASDYKVQSVVAGSAGKYGYPFRIAPTLAPVIQSRSDTDDSEVHQEPKSYGSRISRVSEDGAKKGSLKKSKVPNVPEATRRQDGEDISVEKNFKSYQEPKYRNFEDLEDDFLPRRRMDINYPYSQYEYKKVPRKQSISPRDPYLSPSGGHVDSFYPTVPKIKSYSSPPYGSRGGPSYGAGRYEDPAVYHGGSYGGPSSGYPSSGGSITFPSGGSSSGYSSGGPSSGYSSGGPSSGYSSGGPSSGYSSGGPSPGYSSGGSSPSYPSGGSYGYGDFAIKSNEPITGDIRKKLLDYAGASDLYEGEPDYLREVSRNKYKYGSLGNDYYSYGGQGHRDSYRDFPYVESKITLIKKSRQL